MNEKENRSFVFYESFLNAVELLPQEEQLETLLAICRYGIRQQEPKTENLYTQLVFTQTKPQIDANIKRRKNGEKGGRPPRNDDDDDEAATADDDVPF